MSAEDFAESYVVSEMLGLDPLTVASVVAAWEDYKQDKAVDNSAIAEPIDPTGEDSA